MPPVTFTDADTQAWYAGLATMYGAAAALITDPSGGVLLVKPNYRDHWSLPGGVLEHGEPPHRGCAREVAEEVGLQITVGPLLVVAPALTAFTAFIAVRERSASPAPESTAQLWATESI